MLHEEIRGQERIEILTVRARIDVVDREEVARSAGCRERLPLFAVVAVGRESAASGCVGGTGSCPGCRGA